MLDKREDSQYCRKMAKHQGFRTLFVGKHGLEQAKQAIIAYKTGQTKEMTPHLWYAKKIVDSTLHPGTALLCA